MTHCPARRGRATDRRDSRSPRSRAVRADRPAAGSIAVAPESWRLWYASIASRPAVDETSDPFVVLIQRRDGPTRRRRRRRESRRRPLRARRRRAARRPAGRGQATVRRLQWSTTRSRASTSARAIHGRPADIETSSRPGLRMASASRWMLKRLQARDHLADPLDPASGAGRPETSAANAACASMK